MRTRFLKQLTKYLVILCTLGCLYSIPLNAETGRYRLTFRDDPSTTMVVGWDHLSGAEATVYYGETDHGQAWNAYDFHNNVDRAVTARGMDNRFARLSGLKPDTVYYFVIRDEDGVSDRMSFRTAHAVKKEFAFVAGGDSRNNRGPRQDANKLVSKLRPLFVMFGGDYTYASRSSEWRDWFDDWQLTKASDGRMFPVIAARGNHEWSNSIIEDLFDVPNSDVYYALTFGGDQLRTYTLNSEISAGGNQRDWLKADLSANKNVLWKVAQYHKPMRPHTSSKSEGDDEYNNWADLFYSWNMNLSVESDSHTVKRTHGLKPTYDTGHDQGFIQDPTGTVFIGEGCWGAPLRSNDDDKSWTKASDSFNQLNWVHVRMDKMEIRTIKVDGSLNAEEVDDTKPLELPQGLDVWTPAGGSVVTLLPLEDKPDTDPEPEPDPDGTINSRVSYSSDDAEEVQSGSMYLTSSDLELVNDGSAGDQVVGLRFRDIKIPVGAKIKTAYIQFKVDETGSVPGHKTIYGQAHDNPGTFLETANDISNRNKTAASLVWNPHEWDTRGEVGPYQRTDNFSWVIDEIVSRPGWKPGNAIVLIIEGSGKHTAESFEGDSSGAPLLYIEYEPGPEPDPEPDTSPVTVPGKIQAENYQDSYDTTEGNSGRRYRSENVDVEQTTDTDGGFNVGWIDDNEWLDYKIIVTEPGLYTFKSRVAAARDGGSFTLILDGQSLGGVQNVFATGGWQNWDNIESTTFALEAGTHDIRLQVLEGAFNLNWFAIEKSDTLPPNPGHTPVAQHGQLRLQGTQLVDQAGRALQLKGMSSHGLHWDAGDYLNRDSVKWLRDDWGVNVVRAAMYTTEGGYITNPAVKDRVFEIVDAAMEFGVYVVIDWHILKDGDPLTYQDESKTFFQEMAAKYGETPNVIYEICSEPNGHVTWDANIKPYAQEIIPAIRAIDPDGIVIVGNSSYGRDVHRAAQNPLDFENIMYAVHFDAGSHGQLYRDRVDYALSKGLAVFISDWSTSDFAYGSFYQAESLLWMDFLDSRNVSWINWSLSVPQNGESSGALKNGAPKTGGWTLDQLTESGKFVREQIK